MTRGEAERTYMNGVQSSMKKVAKKAVLHVYQDNFQSANGGLMTAPYHFVEVVLTKMARKGALSVVLDRNTKRWKQYSTLPDMIVRTALPSLRFECPVAKLIRKILSGQTEVHKPGSKLVVSPFPFPESSLGSSWLSPEDEKFRKCVMPKRHKREAAIANVKLRHGYQQNHKK